jgi:N-methylhydantoinase B
MDIPGDCILNAPHPYPVSARNATGQLLPDLMMGCLHQIVPERVAAEGSSTLWNTPMRGGSAVSGQAEAGRPVLPDFEIITFHSGGTGARRTLDGLDGTAFPSGVRTVPVEAIENVSPLIIWRKELRPDSGGPGRTRGGLGQIMEIAGKDDLEFACNSIFDRVTFAPKGRDGGGAGAAGGVEQKVSGKKMRPKGFQVIPDGDRLVLHMPGGGGMGPPHEREAARVARDVRDGLVSAAVARDVYRVAVTGDGIVDGSETRRLRADAGKQQG